MKLSHPQLSAINMHFNEFVFMKCENISGWSDRDKIFEKEVVISESD